MRFSFSAISAKHSRLSLYAFFLSIYADCSILAKFIAANNCDTASFNDSLRSQRSAAAKVIFSIHRPPYLIDPLMKPYFTVYAAPV